MRIDRREFIRCSTTSLAACFAAACTTQPTHITGLRTPVLAVRPRAPGRSIVPGAHELPADVASSVTLYVPAGYDSRAGRAAARHAARRGSEP